MTRPLTPAQVAWLAAAGALTVLTLVRTNPDTVSFRAFYDSALSWRTGADVITDPAVLPNLNPPLLSILIAPITMWTLETAFWIWTAIGFASIAASVHAIVRARVVPAGRLPWLVGAFGATIPALVAWEDGQVVWLLLYPATRAWLAAERDPRAAGLWLAPAIAMKPPLALMAAVLPWRITIAAAVGAIAVTMSGIIVTGWAPWREWLALGSQITWLEWPLSASLWSTAARVQTAQVSGSSLADLWWGWWVVILPVAAALAIPIFRSAGSARWVLAMCWATLVSPLGQVYYLPLAAGPIAAAWSRHRAAVVAVAICCVPMPLLGRLSAGNRAATVACASAYSLAVLLAWIAWRRPAR